MNLSVNETLFICEEIIAEYPFMTTLEFRINFKGSDYDTVSWDTRVFMMVNNKGDLVDVTESLDTDFIDEVSRELYLKNKI